MGWPRLSSRASPAGAGASWGANFFIITASLTLVLAASKSSRGLLVVDVQNCFLPGGSLPVQNGSDVLPTISQLRSKGNFAAVAYSQEYHPPGHISWASTHKAQGPDAVLLDAAAYYYSIYIAAASARAEQEFEAELLQAADVTTRTPYWAWVNQTLHAMYPGDPAAADAQLRQLLLATCGCDAVPTSSSPGSPLWGPLALAALNNSADPLQPSAQFSVAEPGVYRDLHCSALYGIGPEELAPSRLAPDPVQWCQQQLNATLEWRTNLTLTAQRQLIDLRLGDGRSTGKAGAGARVVAALQWALMAGSPELAQAAYNATMQPWLDNLLQLVVNGPTFNMRPMPAFLNLTRRSVYSGGAVSLPLSLGPRARARLAELRFQMNETAHVVIPSPLPGRYPNLTVAEIVGLFQAANASLSSLPLPNDPLLGPLATDYNTPAEAPSWLPLTYTRTAKVCNLTALYPAGSTTCPEAEGALGAAPLVTIQQKLWPDHCQQGTPDAALHPSLAPKKSELLLRKGEVAWMDSYSAFSDQAHLSRSGLAAWLRRKGVASLYIVGLGAEAGVYWSALDALQLGFKVVVVEDAVAGWDAAAWGAARVSMSSQGIRMVNSTEVLH